MTVEESKWFWMMDYCKTNRIPAAQEWAWNRAEEAYNKFNQQKPKE